MNRMRCPSVSFRPNDDQRCELTRSHIGMHRGRQREWQNRSKDAEIVEDAARNPGRWARHHYDGHQPVPAPPMDKCLARECILAVEGNPVLASPLAVLLDDR